MLKIFSILNKKQKISLATLFFLGLIAMVLELLGISLIIPIIYTLINDNFFNTYPSFEFLNEFFKYPDRSLLIKYFLGLILFVYLFKNLYLTAFQWYEARFLNYAREEISYKLFNNFLKKNLSFHLKTNSSTLVTNIRQDLGEYFNGLAATVAIFTELTVVTGITIFLILYEPKAFIISASVIGFFSLVLYFLTASKFKELGKNRQQIEVRRTKELQEGFGGIKEIKSFNIEDVISLKYKDLTNKLSSLYTFTHFLSKIPKVYFELIAVIGVVILTFFLINQYDNSTRIITSIGIFSAAAFKMLPSFNRIQYSFGILKYVDKAVRTLHEYLLVQQDLPKTKSLSIDSKLELKNIDFQYPSRSEKVLDNVNLEIKSGEKIAIIGKTGSGKSTLVDLILGLQSPNRGKILIDGKASEIKNYNWFNSIGYVPQNIYLFDESIEYNITLKDSKNVDQNLLNLVIHVCQLEEFVTNLPKKIHTHVGEKGTKISGGQKQRIGIARALYKNPKIIIFDEATNSLDTKTEEKLNHSLKKNFNDRSIVVITHKEIEKNYFNKIYNIQNGKVILDSNENINH